MDLRAVAFAPAGNRSGRVVVWASATLLTNAHRLMHTLTTLLTVLPPADEAAASGTGLEWMVVAAVVVPAVLLILIMFAGRKNTV